MKKVRKVVKKNILFIILITIIVIAALIYSYVRLHQKPINNKELYIINNVELKSKDLNAEKTMSIDSNETKLITLTVTNNFKTDKKFYVWYKVLTNQNNIDIGSVKSSDVTLLESGNIIEKNTTKEIIVGIKNNNDSTIQLAFGIVYGDQNEQLKLPHNSTSITDSIDIIEKKEYSVGEKIILNDYSRWHVIEESSSNEDYVTLLKDDVINIEESDQALDVVKNKILFDPNDENIKFYLDNTYKKELEKNNIKLGDNGEIRLITLNELLTLGNYNYQDYNYYQTTTPNWLNTNVPWWTMTPFSSDSTYYVYKGNIYFAKDKNITRAAIRPVIKVLKSNIKS